jgi:hypothetical protein
MSEKKPIPVLPPRAKAICAVCGKPSYSASGMHPQCSVARADASTKADLKLTRPVVAKTRPKTWFKPCPKCRRQMPTRRVVCDCGHAFAQVLVKQNSTR